MELDTPDHVASALARWVAVTGGIEAIEVMYDTLEAVTPEDVRAAAEALLDKDRRTIATLPGGAG